MKNTILLFSLFVSTLSLKAQYSNQIFQVDEFGFRNYKPLAEEDQSTISLTITKFNEVNQKYELWKYFLEKADLSKSDSILLHTSEVTGRIDAYNWRFQNGLPDDGLFYYLVEGHQNQHSLSVFEKNVNGTVGNKLRTINFGDSLYSLTTLFDDFQIFMVTCYGLNATGFFPDYCELKRIDLNTGTETVKVLIEDSTQTFYMLPPKIWTNYNSSQLLAFEMTLSKFFLFDKFSLDTVRSIDVDIFQLQLDYQMIRVFAQNFNIIDGKLVVAGSANHLIDLLSGLSNERGFIMEFDDSLQIASVSGFGKIGFGNSTSLVGVEQMPDNTLIGLGATPFGDNASSNAQREIFIAKTTAFGKDSLIIYGHGNHIGYYAIGDASGDLFVVAHFTNSLLTEPNYVEVIKVPQFALSVLEQQGVTKAINVYPNPTTDFLKLSIDAYLFSENTYWKIFNVQGQEVMSKPLLSSLIDVKNLPTGSYVFILEVKGEVFNTVFIKK